MRKNRTSSTKRLIIEVGDKNSNRKSIIGGRLQLPMLSSAAPFFKCPFFQNSSQGLLQALSEEVVTLRHNAGDSIIESNGQGSDALFRVMEGTVAFVVGDKVIGTAENIWFGENSILTDKDMPLPTVIAVNSVETVSLTRKRFWKILRHFPREKKHYINLFQERVREGVIAEQAAVGSAEMRAEIGSHGVVQRSTHGRPKEMAPRTSPQAWARQTAQKRWAAERRKLEDVDLGVVTQKFSPAFGGETIDLRTALTRSREGGWQDQLRPETGRIEHVASRRERRYTNVERASRRILTTLYEQIALDLDGAGGFGFSTSREASEQTAQTQQNAPKLGASQLASASTEPRASEPQNTSAENHTVTISALETKGESDLDRWFTSRSFRALQQRFETSWPSGGSFGPPESRPSTSPGSPYAARMRLESGGSSRKSTPRPKPAPVTPTYQHPRRRLALIASREKWTAFRSLVPLEESALPATWPPYAASSWIQPLG